MKKLKKLGGGQGAAQRGNKGIVEGETSPFH